MAFFSGEVQDRFGLLATIRDNAASSGWQVTHDTSQFEGGELVLGIPNGGFIGLQDNPVAIQDIYRFKLQGYSEYDTGKSFDAQTTRIPTDTRHGVSITVRNCGMRYWMSVNDRRIVLIVKNGTNYETAYLGRLLSIASNLEYPNPLFIGGTLRSTNSGRPSTSSTTSSQPSTHWASTGVDHDSCFFNTTQKAYVMRPDGSWEYIQLLFNRNRPFIYPTDQGLTFLGRNFDGSYPMFEMTLVSGSDPNFSFAAGSVYGYLDGVFATSSEGLAAEDTINQDGENFIVFNNVHQSTFGNLFALRGN